MGGGIVASAGDKRAPVYPARPKWDDVALFYPAEDRALGIVGHSLSSFKKTDHVSAIRVSIALILAGMKTLFSNAPNTIRVGDIVPKTNPNGTENPMHGSKFFANVKSLKDWLLKSNIWNDAEDGVNGVTISDAINRTQVLQKMVGRSGVIIVEKNSFNYATLWDIDKIIGGRDLTIGDTVYFWELFGNLEEKVNKELKRIKDNRREEALMAAAKILFPLVNYNLEYYASICRNRDGTFSVYNFKRGESGQAMIVRCEECNNARSGICERNNKDQDYIPVAYYIHTHGTGGGQSQSLSGDDLHISYFDQIPISLVTDTRHLIISVPPPIPDVIQRNVRNGMTGLSHREKFSVLNLVLKMDQIDNLLRDIRKKQYFNIWVIEIIEKLLNDVEIPPNNLERYNEIVGQIASRAVNDDRLFFDINTITVFNNELEKGTSRGEAKRIAGITNSVSFSNPDGSNNFNETYGGVGRFVLLSPKYNKPSYVPWKNRAKEETMVIGE